MMLRVITTSGRTVWVNPDHIKTIEEPYCDRSAERPALGKITFIDNSQIYTIETALDLVIKILQEKRGENR